MNNIGTLSMGIKAPLIKEGDDIVKIVVDSVLSASSSGEYLCDKDIIGITESVVARSQGNYVTIDEIAEDIKIKYGEDATIDIIEPIYSRNRFAMILKGIARGCKKVRIFMPAVDEVGNVVRNHPFTKMNYDEYYAEICKNEGCEVEIQRTKSLVVYQQKTNMLICTLHKSVEDVLFEIGYSRSMEDKIFSLKDICNDRCEYGLLGSNKATEEKLKLFPRKQDIEYMGVVREGSDTIVKEIKNQILRRTGKDVIVCIYADGCFHDPVCGIWEFADPISMVSYTDADIIESTPNELKLKAFIDDYKGEDLDKYIKESIVNKDKDLKGNMKSQGTTPRLVRDLVASLMDLTSGSGDKGTPIILVQNYFNNYSNDLTNR